MTPYNSFVSVLYAIFALKLIEHS